MRKIKKVEDFPKWFSLEKYDFLKELGAGGWANVVNELLALSQWEPEDWEMEENGITWDELFGRAFVEEVGHIPGFVRMQYRTDAERFLFRGVGALSNSAVAYMATALETVPNGDLALKFSRGSRDFRNGANRGKRKARYPRVTNELIQFFEQPFFLTLLNAQLAQGVSEPLTANRAISVNMELPDTILYEDFKEWLQATRALDLHKAAQKAFASVDFDRWIDDRYVPLLLLCNWAKRVEVEITYPALAEALFPSRRMISESNVRRSIKPAASAWLCYQTREALAALAAKEASAFLPAIR